MSNKFNYTSAAEFDFEEETPQKQERSVSDYDGEPEVNDDDAQ